MSNITEPSEIQDYWRNPDNDKRGTDEYYKSVCRPDFYLTLNPLSENWVRIFKEYIKPNKSILELGCSVGRNLYFLFKGGFKKVHGVEINERAKELARINYGKEIADIIETSSIEDWLKKNKKKFDVVFVSGVFMHIHPKSEWIFKEVADITKEYLITGEVETRNGGDYRFDRNYNPIFGNFGFKEIHREDGMPLSPNVVIRIFKK